MENWTPKIKPALQLMKPADKIVEAIVGPKKMSMDFIPKSFYSMLLWGCLFLHISNCLAQPKNVIAIKGTSFTLNEKPFEFTGVSFFNALYNPTFNSSPSERTKWLGKFQDYGINVIRVWGQWDNRRGFVNTCSTCTLYNPDGSLRTEHLYNLKELIKAADEKGMVVLFVLFQRESWNDKIILEDKAADKAVALVANELHPYRNVILQIWNEHDYRTLDYLNIIKKIDETRIVSNSPGYAGVLGSNEENAALDYLSPHTTREDDAHWEIAPREIALLLAKYNKPVVDDEPARKGTANFGGPKSQTLPLDHILHLYNVRKAGGFVIYHHDMFQTNKEGNVIPPSGIPDPEFSPYHKQVFEYLAKQKRYLLVKE